MEVVEQMDSGRGANQRHCHALARPPQPADSEQSGHNVTDTALIGRGNACQLRLLLFRHWLICITRCMCADVCHVVCVCARVYVLRFCFWFLLTLETSFSGDKKRELMTEVLAARDLFC